MHDLYLDIQDTLNVNTIRVLDDSIYFQDAPFENAIIEITPPTYTCPTLALRVQKGFNIIFNSSNLRIVPVGATRSPLPDGKYVIKYSVSPNQSVFVEYIYFRNLRQIDSYKSILSDLYTNRSKIPPKKFKELRMELFLLKQFIDSERAMAEENFMIDEALAVYKECDNQIDIMKNKILLCQS